MRSFDIAAPTTRWERMARTHGHDFNPFWKCDQCDAIDAEIRAAVAEEREACAKVVDGWYPERADIGLDCAMRPSAPLLAAAIRARESPDAAP